MAPGADDGAARRERLAAARLYLVCPTGPAPGETPASGRGAVENHTRSLPDLVRAAVAGGVDVVQLREKHLPDDELVAVAKALQALCERIGALLIVNDRPVGAREGGAGGGPARPGGHPPGGGGRLVRPRLLCGVS